ncbi:olfactory receptor 10A7-like [Grus americana]|uniref:olfactory receptor 10A7-like n=1 Tax=Grus americana TaxID=9117 RepID=UPI002407CD1D|nr:olfactory receptor 10A7-like [Grus americana]
MEAVEAPGLRNQTYFTLKGFSHLAALQVFLFEGILLMFLITMTGNFLIIIVATTDPALRTPMYYFLKNLALIEICFTLNIVPKMLMDLLLERKVISFSACALQLYFVIFFITSECFLLGAMAYDRYVAICHPLHYAITMNRRVCLHMVIACWIAGIPLSVGLTGWLFSYPFCGSKEIEHFFCDIAPVLDLVCSDTYLFELLVFVSTVIIVLIPFTLIAASYIQIIHTILQMPSAEGRRKAFFTCVAHLVVVTLFYCTTGLIHLKPKSGLLANSRKLVALSYTVVTPMLNPIIYSLRNKEVKHALRKTITQEQLRTISQRYNSRPVHGVWEHGFVSMNKEELHGAGMKTLMQSEVDTRILACFPKILCVTSCVRQVFIRIQGQTPQRAAANGACLNSEELSKNGFAQKVSVRHTPQSKRRSLTIVKGVTSWPTDGPGSEAHGHCGEFLGFLHLSSFLRSSSFMETNL